MPDVCLYLQIHQPYRLRRYRVFDVGRSDRYFDDEANASIVRDVAARSYGPGLDLLADLVARHRGGFRFALGITSTALAQLEEHAPEVIGRLAGLARSDAVEILAETSHHSLVGLADEHELARQVGRHRRDLERLLGVTPTTFRNTELVYDDALAAAVEALDFRAVLAEGADKVLRGRPPGHVYAAAGTSGLRVLLRHADLSDDLAFRFAHGSGSGPLTPARYAGWIAATPGETVNLFLDFETFGEHQRAETGILDFLAGFPGACLEREVGFRLPREVATLEPRDTIHAPEAFSWADAARDLGAWLGNDLQRSAWRRLNRLLPAVLDTGDAELLETWRRLSTSDHLYYMSTKGWPDGEVHSYFRPFESPYEAYLHFMNVLTDLEMRLSPVVARAA